MTIKIFDQFSVLDPQLECRQIEAALAKSVFNQFSVLDPSLMDSQVEAALAKPVFDPFSRDHKDPKRWEDQVEDKAGGGGSGYVAKAVHFDGTTGQIGISSLTSTDNHFFSAVGWIKFDAKDPNNSFSNLFTVDPMGNYTPSLGFTAASPAPSYYEPGIEVSDASGNNYENCNVVYDGGTGEGGFENATWACLIASFDTSGPFIEDPPSSGFFGGVGRIYNGDIDVTGPISRGFWSVSGTSPFIVATNALGFYFGNDNEGNPFLGDVADWRIMPGISLLTAGDISQATRRLFIDANGKPVDPAVATASLGAPCILFSGDHTTFPVNQGTGGAFTLTGTLTNASTSPSD